MQKRQMKKTLYFAAVFSVALLVFPAAAQAKVVAFVGQDSAGLYYEYSYEELLRSYSKKILGTAAPYFNDYEHKGMALFLDDVNGYVDYQEALAAYAKAVFSGKTFDLDAYTAGANAKLAEVARVKVVTYENGRLVYTDKVLADPIAVVLLDLNQAQNAFALRQVIESKALVLGIDLHLYNGFSDSSKTDVVEGIWWRRGSGFADLAEFTEVFSSEVERVRYSVEALLQSINSASSLPEFSALLMEYGEKFELELDAFQLIINSRSEQVLTRVYWSLPFGDGNSLKECFNAAVADMLRSYVIISGTYYDYTVSDMLDIQMPLKPQWYVSGVGWTKAPREQVQRYVDPLNFILPDLVDHVQELIISSEVLHVRDTPTTEAASITTVSKGEIYPVEEYYEVLTGTAPGSEGYWFRISLGGISGWVCGKFSSWVAEQYSPEMLQFLSLSGRSGVTVSDLGYILQGKGILSGTEAVFFQASRSNNINEIFLTSLALHESGNGSSQLANGVLFTPKDSSLPARVVYNMYGIGAVDSNPILKGAEFAYNQGWFSPEEAIIGGAYFVSGNYVKNSNYYQDTLYKMRWNPGAPGRHQYATDIGWAAKQTNFIQQFYNRVSIFNLRFDIPFYIR